LDAKNHTGTRDAIPFSQHEFHVAVDEVLHPQNAIGTTGRNPTSNTRGQRRRTRRRQKAGCMTGLSRMDTTKQSLPGRGSMLNAHTFNTCQPIWCGSFDLELCRQIVAQLECSNGNQSVASHELIGSFASLAFDAEGCRIAQDALEVAGRDVKVVLALKLRGHIREAIDSPFANYVVQKIIEVLPPVHVQFLVDELIGSATETARHPYGVRVLCRLLEHCPSAMIEELILEITENVSFLCLHKFGTYIVQHVMEHGTPQQCKVVIRALASNALGFSRHRHGSTLIQTALAYPELLEGSGLLEALCQNKDNLNKLAQSRYGSRVLEALSKLPTKEMENSCFFPNTDKPISGPFSRPECLSVDCTINCMNSVALKNPCQSSVHLAGVQ